jgi:hypothetical protein
MTARRYAENTEVTSDRSRSEIERTLMRYGASKFAYGWGDNRAVVQFEAHGKRIRFALPLPQPEDFALIRIKNRPPRRRTPIQARAAHDQATRQRWRALLLSIKAKLESVEAGIEEFEEAFMAQIVLPDGSTVGERILPGVRQAYLSGEMPAFPLLAAPKDDAA